MHQRSSATRERSPRTFLFRAAFAALGSIGAALGALAGPGAAWAKVEVWRSEGPSAFDKCHRERVVVSDKGRVRLGHALAPLGTLEAARVWDLARASDGALLVATGDEGKVFRRTAQPDDAPWTVLYDAKGSQVLALAAGPDGALFAGTGPDGQVVDLKDPKHPASRPGPKVKYIWDLAIDDQGNLYAATGPEGELWKRTRAGAWSLLYDSKAAHLLSVAVGPDGSIYAGSDGEGLIYRVGRDGKTSVLFDAPQAEIRALLAAPDGSIYAGTAAETGGTSNSRNSMFATRQGPFSPMDGASAPSLAHAAEKNPSPAADRNAKAAQAQKPAPPTPPKPPSGPSSGAKSSSSSTSARAGGSATRRPATPGENAVYRLDDSGVPREVLRAKALFHALAWAGDRLWAGTGPEGQLYEIQDRDDETSPAAKLDNGQVLALWAEPGGGLLIGTGDPGAVLRLAPKFAARGELVSDVHDTKLVSRFGALTWRAEKPPGTSMVVQCRTGNVGEPDETWSAWSAEQTNPESSRVDAPPGRFVQYRVKLATTDPTRAPELRSISLSYRTSNLAPEITRLDVPDVSASDGSARQARLNLRWDAKDPNDDDLEYRLHVRKEGWPDWIALGEGPITEKTHAWDTTAFPSGLYRLKLVASDRPSNGPDEALLRERESSSFLVDHDPPRVKLQPREHGAEIVLNDDLVRIVKAEYALDGKPWAPIFPDDGLFDSPAERITLELPGLKPGAHVLMVKATDAAGNVGAADLLLQAPAAAGKAR